MPENNMGGEAVLRKPPVLCIVVPCYNEEAVLPETAPVFLGVLANLAGAEEIDLASRVMFVDDGSSDGTWGIIDSLASSDERVLGIRQSRNRGHQAALVAGLSECAGFADAAVTIDCDGQDDPGAMREMVARYREGCDVVYGVRTSRATDRPLKRWTAETYYKLLASLGAEVVYNHADYRLTSGRVLSALRGYREVNLYLRGLFPLIGFRSATVGYERRERVAGSSHYPLGKMLALAFDGITSLSTRPLSLITGFGAAVSAAGFAGVLWAAVSALLGRTVSGWASLTCIVCFMGGVQLLSLGVIGQYVGKVYMEAKGRPRYVISERTWDNGEEGPDVDGL